MGIPAGCGTKGKFPFIATGENIPTGVDQLQVEVVHYDYKPGFWRGCCCTFCIPTGGRVAVTCLDGELG